MQRKNKGSSYKWKETRETREEADSAKHKPIQLRSARGDASGWVFRAAELEPCIVELHFPLGQSPIEPPNNVHYVRELVYARCWSLLPLFTYDHTMSSLRRGQARLRFAVGCSVPARSKHLGRAFTSPSWWQDAQGEHLLTKALFVLGSLIANVSFPSVLRRKKKNVAARGGSLPSRSCSD